MEYDYIIAGSGCAGLSLLYGLLQDPLLNSKKILVIDKSEKVNNDRTWCFWEEHNGTFEPIVFHRWETLEFLTTSFQKRFHLGRYAYKMIKGIDFYNFVLNAAKYFKNVDFKFAQIESFYIDKRRSIVQTDCGKYIANYVFNSTNLFHPTISPENSLLQHFQGWNIRTKEPVFNPHIGTLMDFRVNQQHGDTFMYVLPTSAHEALIEYTLFSERVLEKENYKLAIEHYIKHHLGVHEYEIVHQEFGVIPMSLAKFSRQPKERIVNIGTAGGFTKASSGYTFQFIQKNTKTIIQRLREGKFPTPRLSFREKVYQWYDRTVLEVMISKRMVGKEIFEIMFKKLSAEHILAFLGNESSVLDDLKIINCLPLKPFFVAGLKQLR